MCVAAPCTRRQQLGIWKAPSARPLQPRDRTGLSHSRRSAAKRRRPQQGSSSEVQDGGRSAACRRGRDCWVALWLVHAPRMGLCLAEQRGNSKRAVVHDPRESPSTVPRDAISAAIRPARKDPPGATTTSTPSPQAARFLRKVHQAAFQPGDVALTLDCTGYRAQLLRRTRGRRSPRAWELAEVHLEMISTIFQ